MAAQAGLGGVSALPVDSDGRLTGRLAGPLGADGCSRLAAAAGAGPGDLLLLAVGPEEAARTLLGRLRLHMADTLEAAGVAVRRAGPHFLWVVDFPLFVREEGRLVSAHHPFTRPHVEDEHVVYTDPEQVRRQTSHPCHQLLYDPRNDPTYRFGSQCLERFKGSIHDFGGDVTGNS